MTPGVTVSVTWIVAIGIAAVATVLLLYAAPYAMPAAGVAGIAFGWWRRAHGRSWRVVTALAAAWFVLGLALFSLYGSSTGVGGLQVVRVPPPPTHSVP
ncbi:MAG: hypothetical protein QOH12_1782 [Solirubrobacteraceae bacterium]|jgi:hypothetical protein|nr:hypothetical protein [Solirubrobacteraceae bacterium]